MYHTGAPCLVCRQSGSPDAFVMNMTRLLNNFSRCEVNNRLRPKVNVYEHRNFRCKYGIPCPKLRSLEQSYKSIDRKFLALVTSLASSESAEDRATLVSLLREARYYYPSTVSELCRVYKIK